MHIADICEGQEEEISCSGEGRLHIVQSFYGIQSPTTSSCTSTGMNCATDTLASVRDSCEGELSCRLTASSNVYDDSCNGNTKSLNVTYLCSSKYEGWTFHILFNL